MRRRLSNLLTVLSLLVCVAVAVLWVRSLWVTDTPFVMLGRYEWCANSEHGKITTGWRRNREPLRTRVGWIVQARGPYSSPWEARHYLLYFGVNGDSRWDDWTVHVPHWPLALVTAVAPAAWCRRWRVDRRWRTQGLCRQCGYDLHATPGRCPECGGMAPAVPVA